MSHETWYDLVDALLDLLGEAEHLPLVLPKLLWSLALHPLAAPARSHAPPAPIPPWRRNQKLSEHILWELLLES